MALRYHRIINIGTDADVGSKNISTFVAGLPLPFMKLVVDLGHVPLPNCRCLNWSRLVVKSSVFIYDEDELEVIKHAAYR